jgi:hypothetical protein
MSLFTPRWVPVDSRLQSGNAPYERKAPYKVVRSVLTRLVAIVLGSTSSTGGYPDGPLPCEHDQSGASEPPRRRARSRSHGRFRHALCPADPAVPPPISVAFPGGARVDVGEDPRQLSRGHFDRHRVPGGRRKRERATFELLVPDRQTIAAIPAVDLEAMTASIDEQEQAPDVEPRAKAVARRLNLARPMDFSFSDDNEQGPEGTSWASYQRQVCAVGDTANRAFPMEFADLGSVGVARAYADHRRRRHRTHDFEEFGALKRDRRSESDRGGRSPVVVTGLMECRDNAAFLGVGKFCLAFEHREVSLVHGLVALDWDHKVGRAYCVTGMPIKLSQHLVPVKLGGRIRKTPKMDDASRQSLGWRRECASEVPGT